MEITEISKESSQYNQVLDLLQQFDIHSAESIEFVDSSQGEDDIRHNYIIDKKVCASPQFRKSDDRRTADRAEYIDRTLSVFRYESTAVSESRKRKFCSRAGRKELLFIRIPGSSFGRGCEV